MSADETPTFSAEQASAANSALRAALDLPPERFSAAAFVGMISDEIEQLRRAGFSDDRIAQLIRDSTGSAIDAATIARYYAPPEARRRPG